MRLLMGTIAAFFVWFYDILKKFLLFLFTFPGQLLTAIGGILGVCYTLFSRFTWLSSATNAVQSATTTVSTVITRINTDSPVFSALYGFFAIDSLIEFGAGIVTCTVGVLVVILTGIFSAIVICIPGLLVARATLKLIRISTGGLINP